MNKKLFIAVPVFFLLIFSLGRPNDPSLQEKEKAKKEEKEKTKEKGSTVKSGVISGVRGGVVGGVEGGVQGGVKGGVQGGVQGGVVGGIMTAAIDEDFLREPRKIITFTVEHLLIKPTETISLPQETNLKTESGIAVNYSYTWRSAAKDEVGLEITPTIVEDKGIELKIAIQRNRQTVKEEKIIARNFEPVVVELLEDKNTHFKLADKVTPLIQTVYPPQKYPKALEKLEMVNEVLIMNDTLLINHSRGGASRTGGGAENDPCYLYFWVKGKGVYILSFWPFEGAEPIGVVTENSIRIRHGKDFFAWLSMKPILPEGKWRVWVRNNPDYDPLQEGFKGASQKDLERIKAGFQKENAAFTGVIAGPGAFRKFFGKK